MIWFCLAAGLGAVLRYIADLYLPRRGILVVNIVGSLLAGAALGILHFVDAAPAMAHIVLGGFAGSLTTYATVALAAADQRIQRIGSAGRTLAAPSDYQVSPAVSVCWVRSRCWVRAYSLWSGRAQPGPNAEPSALRTLRQTWLLTD